MSEENNAVSDKGSIASERFIQFLTGCQGRLYAYIRTLILDANVAKDVLQQTNLVVWRKAHEFDEERNPYAWLCHIAYFEVLAHRRDTRRDRHLFDDELLGQLARVAVEQTSNLDSRQVALEQCLDQLAPPQRELIRERYGNAHTVADLAKALGTTTGALATRLYRIRQRLQNCVEGKLAVQQR